jgi:hypothetical protein
MDTRAFASVEDATSWPELQSANGFQSIGNGQTNRPGPDTIGEGFAKTLDAMFGQIGPFHQGLGARP